MGAVTVTFFRDRDGVAALEWLEGLPERAYAKGFVYFFHGREVVVLAHGLTKEGKVPDRDINMAIGGARQFSGGPGYPRRAQDSRAHPIGAGARDRHDSIGHCKA